MSEFPRISSDDWALPKGDKVPDDDVNMFAYHGFGTEQTAGRMIVGESIENEEIIGVPDYEDSN